MFNFSKKILYPALRPLMSRMSEIAETFNVRTEPVNHPIVDKYFTKLKARLDKSLPVP